MPEDKQGELTALPQRVQEGRWLIGGEVEHRRKDGARIAMRPVLAALADYGSGTCGSFDAMENITERKRAREALREQEGFPNYFQLPYRLADGPISDGQVFSGPIRVGKHDLPYPIAQGVTDRKKADAALPENGDRFELGNAILPAVRAEGALDLAREHPEPVDVLITDVVMPQMSGRELSDRLRDQRPDLRCLFVSGYTENVIAHHGVLEPGVHFLQKPFSVSDLARKLREILDEEGEGGQTGMALT